MSPCCRAACHLLDPKSLKPPCPSAPLPPKGSRSASRVSCAVLTARPHGSPGHVARGHGCSLGARSCCGFPTGSDRLYHRRAWACPPQVWPLSQPPGPLRALPPTACSTPDLHRGSGDQGLGLPTSHNLSEMGCLGQEACHGKLHCPEGRCSSGPAEEGLAEHCRRI